MPAIAPTNRIELSPAVRSVLEAGGPESRFLEHYLCYLQALLSAEPSALDHVMTEDGHCYDLEAMGLPPGLEGLRAFRRQVNAAIPDERILFAAVRFERDDIIEADLAMTATQTGEIFGIPATGRTVRFDVHERCRFVDDRLAERWARVDLEEIKRQLTGPLQ